LHEGRAADAKRLAAELLRWAASDPSIPGLIRPEIFELAADMIAPRRKRGRGAPKKQSPAFWYEIGIDYDELRSQGGKRGDCIETLAVKYGCSHRVIEDTLAYYNRAMMEIEAATAD
jgi:hypothetical protein